MSDFWHEESLFIDGELVSAVSGEVFDNVNPATEEAIGVVADAGRADMDAAIGAARRTFDESSWSTDTALRVRCLRQLREALDRHGEQLRATTVAEVGCPVSLTYGAQLDAPVAGLGWVADLAESYEWVSDLGVAEPFGIRSQRYVQREAVGVVAAITPWNFPTQINLAKVGPALAAGCTVVLKPAPDTPWTATLLGQLVANETDIPPGAFNVVTSSDHLVGQQLAEDPRVDLISFTGSTATGRTIMAVAAQNITKVFLELGGKSALIALDDADIAGAAAAAFFQITSHAGQGCAITSRLLLPRATYEEGLDALVALAETWPYGDPTDPAMLMGPLIRESQRQRVLDYIRIGVQEGGRVVTGGGIPPHLPRGYFVQPTVIADVTPDARVAQEEIFGPVLVVIPHDGDDDAVAIANNSKYGLSGGVVSASDERARSVANRIRTGTIMVNGGLYYGADAPFGGYKHSGIGREMGKAGFEEYLEIKTVALGA